MKIIKKVQESKQEINAEIYLKIKIKRENMVETDIIICLKKKKPNQKVKKNIKKITVRPKN